MQLEVFRLYTIHVRYIGTLKFGFGIEKVRTSKSSVLTDH